MRMIAVKRDYSGVNMIHGKMVICVKEHNGERVCENESALQPEWPLIVTQQLYTRVWDPIEDLP